SIAEAKIKLIRTYLKPLRGEFFCAYVIWVCTLFLCVSGVFANKSIPENSNEFAKRATDLVSRVSESTYRFRVGRPVDEQAIRQELRVMEKVWPARLGAPFMMYEALLESAANRPEKAYAAMSDAIKADEGVPVMIDLQRALVAPTIRQQSVSANNRRSDELGRLLPLSCEGTLRDGRLHEKTYGKRDRVRLIIGGPRVPNFRPRDVIQLNRLYRDAGMPSRAVETLLSFIHECPGSHRPKTADLWLEVAHLELAQNHHKLAANAYLRAAYRDDKLAEQARKGLQECLRQQNQDRPAGEKGDVSSQEALRIAELYRRMNLHPFALSALKKAPAAEQKALVEKRKKIEDEWGRLVSYFLRQPRNYLFGHNIKKVEDWGTLDILRPSDTFWRPEDVGK
ncbi:MAG: hypothetical protein ACLFWL_15630, partial [Candidatus Brocadiia bacterium]